MKIQKIEKLNYARFQNFSWDSGLNVFGDGVNILFGWNGSGKTTFSNLFYSIGKEVIDLGCTFKIKLDSGQLSEASNLANVKNNIRVFNDRYVEKILKGSPTIPYIFFAGKEAVDYSEDEKKLAEKKLEFSKINLPVKHDEIAKSTALLIRTITGINSYRKELTGGSTYSSYDKTDFEERIKNISKKVQNGELTAHTDLIRSDINSLQTQLMNDDRLTKNDNQIAHAAQWLLDNTENINTTLRSEPMQKQSQRIKSLSENQIRWIKEGVALHFNSEKKHNKCFFCNSDIKNIDELLKHFSDEVVKIINSLDTFLQEIENQTTSLSKLEFMTDAQSIRVKSLRATFDKLTPMLREKRNAVTKRKNLIRINIRVIQEMTTVVATDLTATAYAIESHYVANQYTAYEEACAELKKATKIRLDTEEEIKKLDEQVRILKQKAKNTHESASSLNNLFKVAFPYRKIEITDNDDGTGYALKRDGVYCNFSSLSEGEKNLIALAYFIYSINDAQNKSPDDGVIVIDDPVSSLDKQAIFQIFYIIVNEIEKHTGRQYFILTHNLDFLGHLKERYRKAIDDGRVQLFSFQTTNQGCEIKSIPPLLEKHRSDYYYVFSELYKLKDSQNLEDSYLIINLLRRWLETFLEFKFSTSGDLQSTLESAYNGAKKITKKWKPPFNANYLEMYRFINHGSHGFSDTESMDDSLLTNASNRIQEALQLVKILDSLHYKKLENMMNGL